AAQGLIYIARHGQCEPHPQKPYTFHAIGKYSSPDNATWSARGDSMKVLQELLNSPFALRLTEILDRRSENRMTEFGMLAQAFEFAKINGVMGDYFEFGVWRGKTFAYARTMARRYRVSPIKFRAFDSFAGLPPVDRNVRHEVWAEGQFACSKPEFEQILAAK